MKKGNIVSILMVVALILPGFATASTTVTLKGVHLCCKGCVTGAVNAAKKGGASNATAKPQQRQVIIEAADVATANKAVQAVAAAGYYGKSDNPKAAIAAGVEDVKVTSANVSGVHLCCGKCVRAVDKAVENLKGASGHTAEKKLLLSRSLEALASRLLLRHFTRKACTASSPSKFGQRFEIPKQTFQSSLLSCSGPPFYGEGSCCRLA